MALQHIRVGTVPPAQGSISALGGTSGSIDSRLHANTFWAHSDRGQSIYALGWGTYPNSVQTATWGPHPVTMKKKIDVNGQDVNSQWEDCCYDDRAGKNDIYIANCGNNANSSSFVGTIFRIPEPTSITGSSTVGSVNVTGTWKFRWPNNQGVDCEAMVMRPTGVNAGTIFFIPKTGASPYGIYKMPGVIETLAQAPTVHTLVLQQSWTGSNINAVTRADWKSDGSELIVASGGPGKPPPFVQFYNNVNLYDSSFNFLGKQEIALAWGKGKYTGSTASWANETIHYSSDGTSIWSLVDSGNTGYENDIRVTITDGTPPPPPPPPPPVGAVWKQKVGGVFVPRTLYTDPADKPTGSTFTNLVPNPSFETDVSTWSPLSTNTLTRTTSGTPKYGSAYAYFTAISPSGNATMQTDRVDIIPGAKYCAAAWVKWRTGSTPRNMRCDIQWFDDLDATISPSANGVSTVTNTSTWIQLSDANNTNVTAPPGATRARVRIVMVSPVNNDACNIDGVQLEQATSLPAYNDSGSGGSPPPPPSGSIVVYAAGDIAGGEGTANFLTSDYIVAQSDKNHVLTMGDNAYQQGTLAQFNSNYDPSWGRFKAITNPTAGNHENGDPAGSGSGYKTYFGARAVRSGKTYYSFTDGTWLFIALDSGVDPNASNTGNISSQQITWLDGVLAARPSNVTGIIAWWHHPRFSSGSQHGSNSNMGTTFTRLYNAGADLILCGHEHNYERFNKINPSGGADTTSGVRQIVCGTGGGGSLGYNFGTPLAQSQKRIGSNERGVLRIVLDNGSYSFTWHSVNGSSTDSLSNIPVNTKP